MSSTTYSRLYVGTIKSPTGAILLQDPDNKIGPVEQEELIADAYNGGEGASESSGVVFVTGQFSAMEYKTYLVLDENNKVIGIEIDLRPEDEE